MIIHKKAPAIHNSINYVTLPGRDLLASEAFSSWTLHPGKQISRLNFPLILHSFRTRAFRENQFVSQAWFIDDPHLPTLTLLQGETRGLLCMLQMKRRSFDREWVGYEQELLKYLKNLRFSFQEAALNSFRSHKTFFSATDIGPSCVELNKK